MPDKQGRDGRRYRNATRWLRRTAAPVCHICGGPIDLSLDYRDAQSWTADHVQPLTTGGRLLDEIRPAHRGCNASRGNGLPRTSAKRAAPRHPGLI